MATAPFIRPLNVQGGTFYTFSSSDEDIGLTLSDSVKKFRMSKFALVRLPNIATPVYEDNKLQFGAIDGALIQGLSSDNNINLAQSFQNYCLNLEAMLVSRTEYDRNLKKTTAERVFWKWLKELGGIRFKQANALESTTDPVNDPRFTEEAEVLVGTNRYYKVVQYVGSIDIVNNVANNVNAYTEIYIHVPTPHGNTPTVLFKTVNDVNYTEGMSIINQPSDPLNNEIIFGRRYNDTHPAGLSINAIFDQDSVGSPTSTINGNPGNWYDPLVGPNAYFTDPDFTDPSNDEITKTQGLSSVSYKRSRLDGICIDFDPASYTQIVNNSITTLEEYNATVTAQPFEFNAVLVYYDIFDPNNPDDTETNLYGVLFLEDVEQISTESGIPVFKKFRPDPITKLNGNSYGYKLNLKYDSSVSNTGVETAVNDYSSFSLEMFTDAMTILQESARVLNDQVAEIASLKNKILSLEDLTLNVTSYQELLLRIETIESSILQSQALFNNTNSIMNLIESNRDEIRELLAGRTSIEVSYNLDAIKPGAGVSVDRRSINNVIINNDVQGFNIGPTYANDFYFISTIPLQEFNNYFRHSTGGITRTFTSDVYIKIDDTNVKWKRGQTFRLVFEDIFDIGNHSLILQTDATNALGAGVYGAIIGVVPGADFDAAGDRPIFDITCIDATTLTFVIDQIR